MVHKIVYLNGESLTVESVDSTVPIQVYLNRYPGSIAVDSHDLPPDEEYSGSWKFSTLTAVSAVITSVLKYSPVYSTETHTLTSTDEPGSFTLSSVNGIGDEAHFYIKLNDRVLVAGQTTTTQNGIYILTDDGTTQTSNWVLTRATDFDATSIPISSGSTVFCKSDSLTYMLDSTITTLDTDIVSFTPGPSSVIVDIEIAKTIHIDILRNQRDSLYNDLDSLYIQIESQNKDNSSILERQQYLRDITENTDIMASTSIENLKAIVIDSWTEPDIETLDKVNKSMTYSIVDYTGGGDFLKISHAINAGKTSLFIKPGVYIETSDIILPNNFFIIGQDKSSVIIHFYGTNSSFIVDGGNPIENTGTISITTSTSSVTGTGTTFTNLEAYDYIKLGTTEHQILSIDSDTSLILINNYHGPSLASIDYTATTYSTGSISNISIAFSTSSGIRLDKTINISMKDIGIGMCSNGVYVNNSFQFIFKSCVVFNCNNGLYIENSNLFSISNVIIKNNIQHGILLSKCDSLSINGAYVYSSGSNGIHISEGSENIEITKIFSNENSGSGINADIPGNIILDSCVTSGNTMSGIILSGNGYGSLSNCTSSNNGSFGFSLSDNSNVSCCISKHNNIGFDISACNNCTISSVVSSFNTSDGILYDANTNESILVGSQINDNLKGLNVLGLDNSVSLCLCRRNTTSQITDSGTSTVLHLNK
jgi:hypothetical protein